MLLDTSFLIDVLRGRAAIEDTLELVDDSGIARVSTVSVMELWEGIHRSDATERERAAVESLLEEVTTAPFDRTAAILAGSINAELAAAGMGLDTADVMIGATALAEEVPVVTRNVDHFERIEGLELVTY